MNERDPSIVTWQSIRRKNITLFYKQCHPFHLTFLFQQPHLVLFCFLYQIITVQMKENCKCVCGSNSYNSLIYIVCLSSPYLSSCKCVPTLSFHSHHRDTFFFLLSFALHVESSFHLRVMMQRALINNAALIHKPIFLLLCLFDMTS